MLAIREFLRRAIYLVTRNSHSRALEAEMAFHREMAARAGRPASSFGNTALLREQSREAWGWTWIDRLFQDLRYAARTLFRSPGFTISAILILAIGIGVNVTAFSLFNMAVLQSLPVRDPGTLLRLQRRSMDGQIAGGMPYPTAIYFRDHAHTLSGILTTADGKLELEDDLEPRDVSFISSNFFDDLGASAAYGRLFSPPLDDAPNAHLVVVLGYHFWQTRFSADPNIVGRTILLNKQAVTVVGITSELFPGLKGGFTDIWIPIRQQPQLVQGSEMLTDKDGGAVGVWGRLAPGATAKSAEAELLGLTGQRRLLDPRLCLEGRVHSHRPRRAHSDPAAADASSGGYLWRVDAADPRRGLRKSRRTAAGPRSDPRTRAQHPPGYRCESPAHLPSIIY